jgi:hypothetical protein
MRKQTNKLSTSPKVFKVRNFRTRTRTSEKLWLLLLYITRIRICHEVKPGTLYLSISSFIWSSPSVSTLHRFLVKQQQRYGSYSTLLMYRGVNSIPTGNNLITIISTRYLLISLITWNYLIDMFLINLSGRAWPTGSIQYSSQSSQLSFLPFDSPIVHLVGIQDCWWPIKLYAMHDLDPGLTSEQTTSLPQR